MDRKMLKAANIITSCRILFSGALLVLEPTSVCFGVTYLACGLSDVADGYTARKTQTESETGARLDSIADTVFLAVCAVKLIPLIRLEAWIWLWVAAIALVKSAAMLLRFKKSRSFFIPHSIANKLTGILLFSLPVSIPYINVRYSAIAVCTVAAATAVFEFIQAVEEGK